METVSGGLQTRYRQQEFRACPKEKADNIFHQFKPSKKDGKAKVSEIDETSKSLYVVVNAGKMGRDGGGGWGWTEMDM